MTAPRAIMWLPSLPANHGWILIDWSQSAPSVAGSHRTGRARAFEGTGNPGQVLNTGTQGGAALTWIGAQSWERAIRAVARDPASTLSEMLSHVMTSNFTPPYIHTQDIPHLNHQRRTTERKAMQANFEYQTASGSPPFRSANRYSFPCVI